MPLFFVKLASRKLKVDDHVRNLISCLVCGQHSDVSFVYYGVHRHAEQIDHDLDEKVFFNCNELRHIF